MGRLVIATLTHNRVMDFPKKIPEVICDPCNSSWLSKSIVINRNEPMKHGVSSSPVKAVWDKVDRVIALGTIKAMVVFDSKEAMVQAVSTGVESISSFCCSMKPWSLQE